MHDDQFRQLLDEFNLSWTGYRKVRKGVKKRISRHMQELNCSSMRVYLDLIRQNKAVRQDCELKMTVSISRFFRDKQLWIGLEKDIIPGILKRQPIRLHVWSAGCACGEEVYSLKIIWHRLSRACEHLPVLEIIGTDKHPDYINKAIAGVYTRGSLKDVPQKAREYYFERRKSGQRFDLKGFVKAGIRWKVQDIFAEPPQGGFDVIFLRNNLLTYYKTPLKKEGMRKVVKALTPGGWLIVGSHEKLPATEPKFRRHDSIPWAYCWKA